MKHVTFSKPMAPYGVGEKRLVPDDVAKRLDAEGYLSASETWPPTTGAKPVRPAVKPVRPVVTPKRPGAQADLGI